MEENRQKAIDDCVEVLKDFEFDEVQILVPMIMAKLYLKYNNSD